MRVKVCQVFFVILILTQLCWLQAAPGKKGEASKDGDGNKSPKPHKSPKMPKLLSSSDRTMSSLSLTSGEVSVEMVKGPSASEMLNRLAKKPAEQIRPSIVKRLSELSPISSINEDTVRMGLKFAKTSPLVPFPIKAGISTIDL